MEKELIASRIKTPDGTILWSRHVHDYVAYQDSKTGEVYILDGGTDYFKTSINVVPAKNVCIFSTAKWKTLRNYIIRYTQLLDKNRQPTGKSGFVRLSNMSDEHLNNLLDYLIEYGDNEKLQKYVIKEQRYRLANAIRIREHDYTSELVENIEHTKYD